MEGVGARLGRSSTRYGPAAVFSGPVRKWKKRWVQVANPNGGAASHAGNGSGGGNSSSHLVLYKWTPTSSQSNASVAAAGGLAVAGKVSATEESPRRKFRYVPVSVIEEQKQEDSAKTDEETKPRDGESFPRQAKSVSSEEKPDVNDVPKEEETQGAGPEREAGDAHLDLSLGLNSHDGERRG
ncbi:unnamed protein product [Spirodela intermedia]|uniref:Uncharacterized protein n=1 Tax=Spirodela intermedia TaxID=51605 RepID=A0A7I8JK31_SPIIN|nr:unnamed protein product [Spirodela intermedia]CAA6670145.1 unnamed protein product [Spirodela intermedia]